MTLIEILVTLIVIAQALDAYSSYLVQSQPGGYESTKWIAWVMTKIGMLPTLLLVKGGVAALIVGAWYVGAFDSTVATIGLACLVAWYAFILDHNIGVLAGAGRRGWIVHQFRKHFGYNQ